MDDAVRERHGCQCRDALTDSERSVTIWENDNSVILGKTIERLALTEWQARYLAAKLYRLSRRIRSRREP